VQQPDGFEVPDITFDGFFGMIRFLADGGGKVAFQVQTDDFPLMGLHSADSPGGI
jgi:hypothetical protein